LLCPVHCSARLVSPCRYWMVGGLPLGLQVLGFPQRDADLFGLAGWIDGSVRQCRSASTVAPRLRGLHKLYASVVGLVTPNCDFCLLHHHRRTADDDQDTDSQSTEHLRQRPPL